jgi:hypothetical protein
MLHETRLKKLDRDKQPSLLDLFINDFKGRLPRLYSLPFIFFVTYKLEC